MKIMSHDFNLDMRLVFKDEKGSGNVNVITDNNNNKLKHGNVSVGKVTKRFRFND